MFIRIIFSFFVCAISFSSALASSDEEQHNLISVNGKAEVQVVPDEVHVSFTVQKNDKSLKVAQKQNDEVVNKILGVMKNKLSIDEKHIQTNFINVNPVYTYVRCNNKQKYVPPAEHNCNTQVFSHFETKKGIAVKLKDTDKLQKLLEEAVDAGVTNINNVSFQSSKFEELQKKAQVMAAKDAKKNAEAIANALDVDIGEPYRINVGSYHSSPSPRYHSNMKMMAMEADSSGGGTISLGQLTITANVSAQFIVD